MADIVVLADAGDGRHIVCKEITAIGRDAGNDVVLNDPHVSRRHAMICRLQDGVYYLVEWFRAATDCIRQREGLVDKFLGDCVYARWEARHDTARAVWCAVDATCQLNRISRRMRDTHAELPQPLTIGVGITLGDAAIGTDKDHTALGDTVNVAFRLQARSKTLGKDIVIADEAYKRLPESTWTGREQRVKVEGKTKPVDVLGLSFSEAEMLVRLGQPVAQT
jgi:class 3 adenylate cyclase